MFHNLKTYLGNNQRLVPHGREIHGSEKIANKVTSLALLLIEFVGSTVSDRQPLKFLLLNSIGDLLS
jgi:hypothetical protein